ncbi:DUF6456 domain-containing protein [Allosphingosinicella sp.]|jgi:hypothetical protein|uniref:DUF6456 domain-containing protein n=1 Tax=Allosphingosinicella sp. TaxID=2823234 RepID=UPI002F2095C7
MKARRNRILVERALAAPEEVGRPKPGGRARNRPARSVTVNLVESPLGWLKARGLVNARQFEAGEKLRDQWERAQFASAVTMRWDAPPIGRSARRAPEEKVLGEPQMAARSRFEEAVEAVGGGLGDILWRVVCAGEGMRDAERALGWPARAGKLVLGLALDRLADHYHIA